MLAAITFDNIFSGLIGALIGVAISFGIAWWNALRAAKEKLRGLLVSLKSYEFATVGNPPDTARERFIAAYPEILNRVISYRGLLPIYRRNSVSTAFRQFRGITPATQQHAKFFYAPPGNQQTLDGRVEAMLASLKYLGE